jgi:hypothetical protein
MCRMHGTVCFAAALALLACSKTKAESNLSAAETPAPPPVPTLVLSGKAPASVAGTNLTLDAAAPECRAGATCTMTLRLAALGDYHINKEYPFKLVATAAPGITLLGNGDASTFSRAAGDFREESEKVATMTVRFKPAAAGEAKISGTYKLSVCSAANCQIEQASVQVAVPVL